MRYSAAYREMVLRVSPEGWMKSPTGNDDDHLQVILVTTACTRSARPRRRCSGAPSRQPGRDDRARFGDREALIDGAQGIRT